MYIPNNIMSGKTLHYKRHLALNIGQYCQVHEEDTPRNGQTAGKKSSICLGPSGNTQDGFKFMGLHFLNNITRRSWDAIPMPDTVIARVNELAKEEPEHFFLQTAKAILLEMLSSQDCTQVEIKNHNKPNHLMI